MIWALLIVSMALAFLFGGIESGLITVSRVRARHAASEGDRCATRLANLLEKRPELLEAAMAVHHFFTMASFVLASILCRREWGNWGLAGAVILGIPFFLIALELAPKSIFRLYPFRLLRRLTPLLSMLRTTAFLWRAPARVLEAALNSSGPVTPDIGGLDALVKNITTLNLLPPTATTLLERYTAFAPLTAANFAKPWSAVSAISADMPLNSVLPFARQHGQRYHPVLGSKGEVMGYLDASALPGRLPPDRMVRQFTQPLQQIPDDTSALRCLQIMRKSGAPMALVVNGGTEPAGILTLESLFERLLDLSEKPKV
jgi:CBS domain containing-hemolysin-like protein